MLRELTRSRCPVPVSCEDTRYFLYKKIAYFAIMVYVVGVPIMYAKLLSMYNIPAVAAELTRDGVLRSLCEFSQHQEVPGVPAEPVSNTTAYTMTDEHLDILYEHYVSRPGKAVWLTEAEDPNTHDSGKPPPPPADAGRSLASMISHPLLKRVKKKEPRYGTFWMNSNQPTALSQLATRKEKMNTLLKHSTHVLNLTSTQTTWDYAHDDPRLRGSHESIGELFQEFHSSAWFWCLMEQAIKLLITITLTLVDPGSIVQVVTGTVLMFFIVLIYLSIMPYADKTFNQIAFTMQLVLFLFFFCATFMTIYVKYGVPLSNNSQYLFNTCITMLTVFMFAIPGIIIYRRLRFKVEVEEEEEEEESESDSSDDSEDDHDHGDGGIEAKLTTRTAALLALARADVTHAPAAAAAAEEGK